MHLLLTDESNLAPAEGVDFFTYGGLIVPIDRVAALHSRIAAIRVDYGFRPEDSLKFSTNSRPQQVSPDAAKNAKRDVIEACIDNNCRFIAYVVLHAIAKGREQAEMIQWGANTVISKFNTFLRMNGSHGIVAVDRLPQHTEFEYLAEKFVRGISLPDEGDVALDRIVLFSATCINASHLNSAMDIVLGSWRYAINGFKISAAAKEMMQAVTKLIWCEREGEDIFAFEKGLVFRPREVRYQHYQAQYKALLDHINRLIADDQQAPH